MKRSSRGGYVLFLLVSLLLGSAGSLLAADEIVVPRDAETIADALLVASEGTVIVVDPPGDRHQESVIVDVPEVTIRGRKRATILEGLDEGATLIIRADGVSVETLTVRAGEVGIRVEGTECSLHRITVTGASHGIELIGALRCDLLELDVSASAVGIGIERARWTRLRDFAISDALNAGIRLVDSSDSTIEDGRIDDCGTGLLIEQDSVGNLIRGIAIERFAAHGVRVAASSENRIESVEVIGGQIGVLLETATGNSVSGCTIRDVGVAIKSLQSAQNRLLGNTAEDCAEDGISLEQSSENTITHNTIRACVETGLRIEGGTRNLLLANRVDGCNVGFSLHTTHDGRALRNVVEQCSTIGFLLMGSSRHQVLDNEVWDTPIGMDLDMASETVLLRNRIVRSVAPQEDGDVPRGCAILVRSGSNGSRIGASDISESDMGIAVAGGEALDIVDGEFRRCGTGIVISSTGGEIHIEGNLLSANRIGLRVTSSVPPSLVNNTFSENVELDIQNQGELPVHAVANWWDADGPRVSGPVLLESAGGMGTVALGAALGPANEVLGRILQLSLESRGYEVIDLIGVGDSEQLLEALAAGDVDVIWWNPGSRGAQLELPRGPQVFPSQARQGWIAVATDARVDALPAATLTGLFSSSLQIPSDRIRLAAPSELGADAYSQIVSAYGLNPSSVAITWVRDTAEAEAMIKLGGADVVLVDGLEETLTRGTYTTLIDDLGVLGGSTVSIVWGGPLLDALPELAAVFTDLAGRLTTDALHDLANRIRLLGDSPEDAARDYLLSAFEDEE